MYTKENVKNLVKKYRLKIAVSLVFLTLSLYVIFLCISYNRLFGDVVLDRYGYIISIKPNDYDEIAFKEDRLPEKIKKAILNQEDNQFYWHFGFNPYRMTAGFYGKTVEKKKGYAVSTVPEQLVKNLLRNNNQRTVGNKIHEVIGSISLSVFLSKDEVLSMYSNTVPMGNGVVGLAAASEYYFHKKLENLDDAQIKKMMRIIKNPNNNPYKESPIGQDGLKILKPNNMRPVFYPELVRYCSGVRVCQTTIDKRLTDTLRIASKKVTQKLWDARAENAALVVLDVKSKGILSIVGTPDPTVLSHGYQINMAEEYRAVGSTIKPFIYALAFDNGAGPLTIVNDSPLGLVLDSGFTMYPKNFDGKYKGKVTLQEALSQSLNIPSVKVMHFVGLQNFYNWFETVLKIEPAQSISSYGSSTALGALELSPLQLAYMFTVFSQNGSISPYQIIKGKSWETNGLDKKATREREIISPEAVNSVVSVLKNRSLGVEQFGVNSNLQLPVTNYGVKTGTSKNYHDSWVVGFTPEIVTVAWVGNARNDPLAEITGQGGAGDLWEVAMNELLHRGYITDMVFKVPEKKSIILQKNIVSVSEIEDFSVFIFPKNGDRIKIENNQPVSLSATGVGKWILDGKVIGIGSEVLWKPKFSGFHTIIFSDRENKEEILSLTVELENSVSTR